MNRKVRTGHTPVPSAAYSELCNYFAIAAQGHNAWSELWIPRPARIAGPPSLLRRRLEQEATVPPTSPMETMRAATTSMSDALKAALTLVNHVKFLNKNQVERRLL